MPKDKKDDLSSDDQSQDDQNKGEEGQSSDQKDQSVVIDQADHMKVVKESMKRKEKISELTDEVTAANAKATKLSDDLKALETRFDGIDPEKVRELLNEKKEADRKGLEDKGEYQRILDQVNTEHKTAVKTLTDDFESRIEELQGKLGTLSGTNQDLTIGRSFSDSEFVREELTLPPSKARQIYGSHFEVSETGVVVGYDKPKGASERTPIVDGNGNPASFADAIKKIVEADADHDQLIRSKMKNGSGSTTETSKQKTKVKLTGMDKISAGLKTLPQTNQPKI